jgi:hypothetical protein
LGEASLLGAELVQSPGQDDGLQLEGGQSLTGGGLGAPCARQVGLEGAEPGAGGDERPRRRALQHQAGTGRWRRGRWCGVGRERRPQACHRNDREDDRPPLVEAHHGNVGAGRV